MDANGYMTLKEAAQELGIARTLLYHWASIKGGRRLNIVTILGRRAVSIAEVRHLKAAQNVPKHPVGATAGVAITPKAG